MAKADELSGTTDAERRLRFLLEMARRGDECALPPLRKALDANPELWREFGDVAAQAEGSWVRLICGVDLVAQESLRRRLVEMKAELAGPSPTPLIKLLVQRIAVCWLQACYADAIVARLDDLSLAQAKFAQERQGRAHRGYLTSLAALATAQRMLPVATTPTADDEALADATAAEDDAVPSLTVVDGLGAGSDTCDTTRRPSAERGRLSG